jgi:hypothetical protein
MAAVAVPERARVHEFLVIPAPERAVPHPTIPPS